MKRSVAVILLTLALFAATAHAQVQYAIAVDGDRDAVNDGLEQELLVKFAPVFMVAAKECDGLPAEFARNLNKPKVSLRNGTIYGQVFKNDAVDGPGTFLEVHYYDLWARDCGRAGHDLDPEHVSVLVGAVSLDEPAANWKALYWYAAAHEGTVCDASSGARALSLEAETHGATIWVSRGKHGSFLSESRCSLGCGSDRCVDVKPMPYANLINIGEPGAPLNGAVWAQSSVWTLKSKMTPDFTGAVVARLDDAADDRIVSVNAPMPPTKAVILSGNSSLTGVLVGNESAGKALLIGGEAAAKAAGKGAGKGLRLSGRSLWVVGRALGRVFGFRTK